MYRALAKRPVSPYHLVMSEQVPSVLISVITGLVTGLASSALVVLYFEYRQYRKHALSRSHILQRFSTALFGSLTIVRVAVKLKHPDSFGGGEAAVVKELEGILGRYDPSVLMSRLASLPPGQHRYLFEQLQHTEERLYGIFSDSVAHKTVEGDISAAIAEEQEWVNWVVQDYVTFPELLNGTADQHVYTLWMTHMANLVENTFAILGKTIQAKTVSEGALRWGSRAT
jgi:hypothetical protein